MSKVLSLIVVLLLLNCLVAEKDYTQLIQDLNSTIKNKNLLHYHYSYNQLA